MKKGDKVKVIDAGEGYSSYHTMFRLLGMSNPYNDHPAYLVQDKICTVLNIQYKEGSASEKVVAVEYEHGNQAAIGINGLQLVTRSAEEVFKLGEKVVSNPDVNPYHSQQGNAEYGVVTLVDNDGWVHVKWQGTRSPIGYSVMWLLKYKPEAEASTKTERVMKFSRTKKVTINGAEREVTVVTLISGKKVRTGYAVKMPEDKPVEGLATTIAMGRAMKDRTNLTPNMEIGKGMDEKYILAAVADHHLMLIEKGEIQIKGIREKKK